jgi:hypothetical protein
MQLLPEERVIVPAGQGLPTLTTHRLWSEVDGGSDKEVRAILLEDLCSCSVVYHENPQWLGLAAICLLVGVGVTVANSNVGAAGALVGVVLAGLCWWGYRLSKTQRLGLRAASGEISRKLSGEGVAQGIAFIDFVLRAKNERYLSLRKGNGHGASA